MNPYFDGDLPRSSVANHQDVYGQESGSPVDKIIQLKGTPDERARDLLSYEIVGPLFESALGSIWKRYAVQNETSLAPQEVFMVLNDFTTDELVMQQGYLTE
jgi:hypothetical protein